MPLENMYDNKELIKSYLRHSKILWMQTNQIYGCDLGSGLMLVRRLTHASIFCFFRTLMRRGE